MAHGRLLLLRRAGGAEPGYWPVPRVLGGAPAALVGLPPGGGSIEGVALAPHAADGAVTRPDAPAAPSKPAAEHEATPSTLSHVEYMEWLRDP